MRVFLVAMAVLSLSSAVTAVPATKRLIDADGAITASYIRGTDLVAVVGKGEVADDEKCRDHRPPGATAPLCYGTCPAGQLCDISGHSCACQ